MAHRALVLILLKRVVRTIGQAQSDGGGGNAESQEAPARQVSGVGASSGPEVARPVRATLSELDNGGEDR